MHGNMAAACETHQVQVHEADPRQVAGGFRKRASRHQTGQAHEAEATQAAGRQVCLVQRRAGGGIEPREGRRVWRSDRPLQGLGEDTALCRRHAVQRKLDREVGRFVEAASDGAGQHGAFAIADVDRAPQQGMGLPIPADQERSGAPIAVPLRTPDDLACGGTLEHCGFSAGGAGCQRH